MEQSNQPAKQTADPVETELVRQIASAPPGEASVAEDKLYRRMAPRVRLYGLRHLRDEQAASDLVQQVLLIVIEALRAGRLREPEKLASFVFGTCRMTTLDLRRNAARRQGLLDRFAGEFPVIAQPAIPVLNREQLERCLAALAERERSVVMMSFYDDQSASDVGDFLGVSQANVRVIRHRALGRLRDCMNGRRTQP